jgi:hypothetical protein
MQAVNVGRERDSGLVVAALVPWSMSWPLHDGEGRTFAYFYAACR